jgi:UDP-N-acetylmuramate dehydrogenase
MANVLDRSRQGGRASRAERQDVSLAAFNTLALPGRAARYARIASVGQLTAALAGRRFVLGGGSNLVLTGDFDGLVLHMAIPGKALAGEDAEAWYVRAGAGENWHGFVQWTLAQGWPGLENLSLIPGTAGAAPIQNVGAYGLEVSERFHSLRAFDMHSGEIVRFDRAACRFGYRDSVFRQEGWHLSGRFVITGLTFSLPKNWRPVVSYGELATELAARGIEQPGAGQIADAVIALRRRKLPDPARLPNAGSFFRNPLVDAGTAGRLQAAHPDLPRYPQPDGRVKLAAAWLIEQAGWKGRDLGPVGMYEKQALVLVNRGGATGADVLALMRAVQRDVRGKFGVDLTPEPVFP